MRIQIEGSELKQLLERREGNLVKVATEILNLLREYELISEIMVKNSDPMNPEKVEVQFNGRTLSASDSLKAVAGLRKKANERRENLERIAKIEIDKLIN